jgi:hypothetical protein
MIKIIIILSLNFFYFSQVQANLIDKVKLEELIENRIEKKLAYFDSKVKIIVRFTYKANEKLPGLTLEDDQTFEPVTLTVDDIQNVKIEIRSHLSEINKEMQEMIYSVLPIKKSQVTLSLVQVVEKPIMIPEPIIAKDLWDISSHILDRFFKALIILSASAVFLLLGALYFVQRNNKDQSRQNFAMLSHAITEQTSSGSSVGSNIAELQNIQGVQNSIQASDESVQLSIDSLTELLADCYWCSQDSYAHWLWKHLNFKEKQEVMQAWPPLKKYSAFFVGKTSEFKDFHNHPYYIQPEKLAFVSQEAILKEINKNPDLWLSLSPMRQTHLVMPIAEKMKVVKKGKKVEFPKLSLISMERDLPSQLNFGALSFKDESSILKDPSIVPLEVKEQVCSLVWLSLKNPEFIQEKLSQFDARSLASAWIAAPEILDHLEKFVPEKKLKMLHRYLEQTPPSRESIVYKSLVQSGLYNDVA